MKPDVTDYDREVASALVEAIARTKEQNPPGSTLDLQALLMAQAERRRANAVHDPTLEPIAHLIAQMRANEREGMRYGFSEDVGAARERLLDILHDLDPMTVR